jgi:hypothetical protein
MQAGIDFCISKKFIDKAVEKEPYYKLHFDCTARGKSLDL